MISPQAILVPEIVKDTMFLSPKAEKATEKDKYIAKDLLDTLKANKDRCVGLAANMIGYNKAIICVLSGVYDFVMINPVITNKNDEYETEEGCLSLIGERKCRRYKEIEVDNWDDETRYGEGMIKNKRIVIISGLYVMCCKFEIKNVDNTINDL